MGLENSLISSKKNKGRLNIKFNILEKLFTQKDMNDSYIRGKESKSHELKGSQEANQNTFKKKQIDKIALKRLVKKSNRLLVSISSHKFPIDLFPDTLNIEEGRITIITRMFLFSKVHSIDIKYISNIFINTMPFYAQLGIVSKTFENNEIWLNALRQNEAIYARRIIEGLRIFVSKGINTSDYTKEELLEKLEELSTTETVT